MTNDPAMAPYAVGSNETSMGTGGVDSSVLALSGMLSPRLTHSGSLRGVIK